MNTQAGTYIQAVFADATKIAAQFGRIDFDTVSHIVQMIMQQSAQQSMYPAND
jgi:hypothetical protein